jgi:hypothetical protein
MTAVRVTCMASSTRSLRSFTSICKAAQGVRQTHAIDSSINHSPSPKYAQIIRCSSGQLFIWELELLIMACVRTGFVDQREPL